MLQGKHKGSRLASSLMGSVKPNETPYRSIIIDNRTGALDIDSLLLIEDSIESCRKFLRDRKTPLWGEKILEDFRFLDLKFIESALSSMAINY